MPLRLDSRVKAGKITRKIQIGIPCCIILESAVFINCQPRRHRVAHLQQFDWQYMHLVAQLNDLLSCIIQLQAKVGN